MFLGLAAVNGCLLASLTRPSEHPASVLALRQTGPCGGIEQQTPISSQVLAKSPGGGT